MSKQNTDDNIIVPKFTITLGNKHLFKEASISLNHGKKYGLVGINGCGKTTLMKFIADKNEEFEKAIAPHIDILLLEQEVLPTTTTALETVINSDEVRIKLLKEEEELDKYLSNKPQDDDKEEKEEEKEEEEKEDQDDYSKKEKARKRLNQVHQELVDIQAFSAEARAAKILSGLGFEIEQHGWSTDKFSGGWRMRLSLARALFRRPRLLLLDEPTNHLDLYAVIWLEEYLQKEYPHTIVVVSHDKSFLNNVCTDILHCFNSKLIHHKGNYQVFEILHNEYLKKYVSDYDKQQRRLKQLKESGQVTTDISKTSSRETKNKKEQRNLVINGKNSSKGKNDGEKEPELLQPIYENKMKIFFTSAGDLPSPIIKIESVSFNYPEKQELFSNVSFGIDLNSRIAIVGANGTGKSTLLKLIQQQYTPTKGDIWINRKVRIGIFNQHSTDQLDVDKTPVEYIQEKYNELKYQEIRNMLGKFGLKGVHAEQKINTLSGGQKARVVFVELGLKKAHLLLLDEPTNHLDLETVDCLIEGLKEFKGGILIITHNVSLISEITNEIWVASGTNIEKFNGDFQDYRNSLV